MSGDGIEMDEMQVQLLKVEVINHGHGIKFENFVKLQKPFQIFDSENKDNE